jgi:hypothetical protein
MALCMFCLYVLYVLYAIDDTRLAILNRAGRCAIYPTMAVSITSKAPLQAITPRHVMGGKMCACLQYACVPASVADSTPVSQGQ